MKKHFFTRLLAFVIALLMLEGEVLPVYAKNQGEDLLNLNEDYEKIEFTRVENIDFPKDLNTTEEPQISEPKLYEDNDNVRVSIVLEDKPTLNAGFSKDSIANNNSAIAYRNTLEANQAKITSNIETAIGNSLDVKWNLTLLANIISADVRYGQIEEIKKTNGVKDVFIEERYEITQNDASSEISTPSMIPSSTMTGSNEAWALGYTGAGSRIAIIDTGIDSDHISFDSAAYNYAMQENADNAEMELDEYKESVDVMTIADINHVKNMLHAEINPELVHLTDKIPFAYNYIDKDYDITHDNDEASEHGSHVAGIALANRYIRTGEKEFKPAISEVSMQGIAPDAQAIVMKVFGKGGGAYDSDYMVAIEDAVLLGCDSINLSLGTNHVGNTFANKYQNIMDSLTQTGIVVTISAGNSSYWYKNPKSMPMTYNYAEDVNMDTVGAPGSFTNSLAVASVDNVGKTCAPLILKDGTLIYYAEKFYSNKALITLSGKRDYILFDNVGVDSEGNNLLTPYSSQINGKIVFVNRGGSTFAQKMDAAAAAGAVACIIINNQSDMISMDLSTATSNIPCIIITQEDGEKVLKQSEAVNDNKYYTGQLEIASSISAKTDDVKYPKISSYNSWGIPGKLILKPEITAPGGSIYSVNGADTSGHGYEYMSGTSMAAPQIAGMVALLREYIKENNLEQKTGLTSRQLCNSLLMSTAAPLFEEHTDNSPASMYSLLCQGAGLVNVGSAVNAKSYILMDERSTASYEDGKVKAELGDDPERNGNYDWCFYIHNFSDKEASYKLNTLLNTQDIFTESGISYMDTLTTGLNYNVSYTVNGEVYNVYSTEGIDVNYDDVCDSNDIKAILDYAVGKSVDISPEADMNKDGKITSYDAYLLLKTFSTDYFTVKPDDTVKVCVNAKLTSDCKDYLDANYNGGAYIEGYTYINSKANSEGAYDDVNYSVPVLGFYGSWTDSSMFDKNSAWDKIYGTADKLSYLGIDYTNALKVKYQGKGNASWYISNPYNQKELPIKERLAISGDTLLDSFYASLIRNATLLAPVITDANGKVLYIGDVLENKYAAYYDRGSAVWENTAPTIASIAKTLNELDINEDEDIVIALYAIPEYYVDCSTETINKEYVKDLIENNTFGEGASLKYKVRVDNTAPKATEINKSLLTGAIDITAIDNNYISMVSVLDSDAQTILYKATPEQKDRNEATITSVNFEELGINNKAYIVLADYAGNEATYEINYNSSQNDDYRIELNNKELCVGIGCDKTITATVCPISLANKNVIWTSSNTSVATVNNGKVEGIKLGKAIITATVEDHPNLTARCNIEVVPTLNATTELHCSLGLNKGSYLSLDFSKGLEITDSENVTAGYTVGGMSVGERYGLLDNRYLMRGSEGNLAIDYAIWDYAYMPLDMANFPECNNFKGLLYPANNDYLCLMGFNDDQINTLLFENCGKDICAVAYTGAVNDQSKIGARYIMLGNDGSLKIALVYVKYLGKNASSGYYEYESEARISNYITTGIEGLTSENASMSYYKDSNLEGLFILEADSNTIYWADLKSVTNDTAKVTRLGSINSGYLCSLISEFDYIKSASAALQASNSALNTGTGSAIEESALDKLTKDMDFSNAIKAKTVSLKSDSKDDALTQTVSLESDSKDDALTQTISLESDSKDDALTQTISLESDSKDDILTQNPATGSLSAVKGEIQSITTPKNNKTGSNEYDVIVTLSEEEPVTNGMLQLNYDEKNLNFEGLVSGTQLCSVNSSEDGLIDIAYVSEKEINAYDPIVSLGFNYKSDEIPAKMYAYTTERNESTDIPYEPTILTTDGLWCSAIPNQVYTGKAIKPDVEVYDGTTLLQNGVDYTIKYLNNKKIADENSILAPTVIITGKGNYSGTIIKNFSILPINIESANVSGIELKYSGKYIPLKPVVKLGKKTLKKNKDYTIISTKTKEPVTTVNSIGEYEITIKGIGIYDGQIDTLVVVSDKIFTKDIKVASISAKKYTGEEITPVLKLSYKGEPISNDNFDISYSNNILPGTATVTITSQKPERFVGSKTVTFKINGTSIKNAKLITKIPSKVYDGLPYNPDIKVKLGDIPLTEGVDYEINYTNPVNAGTGKVSITGINGYSGKATYSYKITAYNVNANIKNLLKINNDKPIVVKYEKGGCKPLPSITFAGTTLDSKNYKIKYSNTDKVATAGLNKCPQMTITFKGNLKGSLKIMYTITPQSLENTSVYIQDAVYSATNYSWRQNAISMKVNGTKTTPIVITDTNGKNLEAEKDYDRNVKYFYDEKCTEEIINQKTLPAGTTIYVKIYGKDKYCDSIVGSYRVVAASIGNAQSKVSSKTYTGKAITLDESEIELKIGNNILIPKTDYVIVPGSYTNNINKGTASVTVKGIGNYGGTTQVNFNINSKLFSRLL